jgi:peptidoglycan/LPS O-acetylase OafA/YrhL/lysophospholipase L1-like esterase
MVLVSHGFYFTDRVHGIGRVGVNLFFFISGILVFRSLNRTRAATAWERTRTFWWRRLRRLYPALISYSLAGIGVVWLAGGRSDLPLASELSAYFRALPVALVYGTNYWPHSPLALVHLWSLACEMQFYLVAPMIYWLGGTGRRRRNVVFGSLLVLLMGMGAALPLLQHGRPSMNGWKYRFEFAVWPMMLGFCCEYKRDWFRALPARTATLVLWLGAGISGLSMALMVIGMEMKPLVIATGALLLAPCLLAYLFGRPMPGLPGQLFRWLGERTYSIYLWQQPFTICGFLPTSLHPLGATAATAMGGVWFHFFERPFLSAGRKAEIGLNGRSVRKRSAQLPVTAGAGSSNSRVRAAAVVLILLLLVVLGIGWRLRARYEQRLRAEIWPAAPPAGLVQVGSGSPGEPAVLLLGDSRITQWELPRLAGWRVINAGLNGSSTGQMRLRTAALLDRFHPKAVVIQAGINDLKYLGLHPELSSSLVALTSSNLLSAASECAAHGCRVLVLETWPAGRPSLARLPVWSSAVATGIQELNAELRAAASPEKGIWIVDLFQRAGLNPAAGIYRDTLHLAPQAYARLTPALEQELANLR